MTKRRTFTIIALLLSAALTFAAPTILVLTSAPTDGTNEVQTLTFDNNITGGTFTLQLTGSRNISREISWSATTNTILANITAGLASIREIGADGATASAGTISGGHGTVLVTFAGAKTARLNLPLLKVATNSLTGTTHTLTIAETTPGVTATGRDQVKAGSLAVNQINGAVYFTDHDGPLTHWRANVNAPTPTPTATATATATVTPTATPTP